MMHFCVVLECVCDAHAGFLQVVGYTVFCGLVSVYTATGEGNSNQLHNLIITLECSAIYSV